MRMLEIYPNKIKNNKNPGIPLTTRLLMGGKEINLLAYDVKTT